MKLSSKFKKKSRLVDEFSLLFGFMWSRGGVHRVIQSMRSASARVIEPGIQKRKSNKNKMEFKIQRVQQGPPFHPLESSRLVESGRPLLAFNIINLVGGHSDSANYQDETIGFLDFGGVATPRPLHDMKRPFM